MYIWGMQVKLSCPTYADKSQCKLRCGFDVTLSLILGSLVVAISLVVLIQILSHWPLFYGNTNNSTTHQSLADCIVMDERWGEDNGIENELWYFREDYFLNSHHHFWHTYVTDYPQQTNYYPDRGGEIFYFMHHEFMARYFNERSTASSALPEVVPLNLRKGAPVSPGYKSHLTLETSGSQPAPRPNGQPLIDIISPRQFLVREIAATRRRILNAITVDGYILLSNGTNVSNSGWRGVNILGYVFYTLKDYPITGLLPEYSTSDFGLGYHGQLHSLMAFIMNPYGADATADPGVLLPSSTSLRDPVFYRIHKEVEDIFRTQKLTLEPYKSSNTVKTEFPLLWPNLRITDVKVISSNSSNFVKTETSENELHTFWGHRDFIPTFGLDWKKPISSSPRFCSKHLDHGFHVIGSNAIGSKENTFEEDTKGTVRIFLAPRYTRDGAKMTLEDQFPNFFTLDRFVASLTPGKGQIVRPSTDSALSLPADSWLGIQDNKFNSKYCGCGLPHHLLLPKGTIAGKTHDLFVMVTPDHFEGSTDNVNGCENAPIWCPNRDERKYPDAYPMGYPFDRRPPNMKQTLEEWVREYTNMQTIQVKVKHLA